jgi:hypothetical protein
VKTVVKALLAISVLAVIIGLLASGTVDLKSSLGTTAQQFISARENLKTEDFGWGIHLGGGYDETVALLGKPGEATEFGTYRSATYYLPIGEPSARKGSSEGRLVITADEDIIHEVVVDLSDARGITASGVFFSEISVEKLQPQRIMDQIGKPAARFLLLGDKVYSWYLIPLFKKDPVSNVKLTGSVRLTAKFTSGRGKLRVLNVHDTT